MVRVVYPFDTCRILRASTLQIIVSWELWRKHHNIEFSREHRRSRTYCGTSIIYICFVDIQPIGFPYHGRMEKAIYAGDTLPRYHSSDVLCKFIALSSTLFTFVVVVAVPKLTASTDDLFRPSISKLSICATQILKMDFQSDFIFNIAAGLVMDAQHTEHWLLVSFWYKGVKISADTYRELILEDAVLPWAEENAENIDWCLQQDWAPAHGAKKTIEWCEANLPGFWTKSVWPSNSPDLNPLDFAIWGILEQKACAIKHKSIDSLKRALEKAREEITPEMIAAILKNFRKRLDACIEAEGGHFECS
ncbi:hypothetical protein QR680_007891 [Steinernema hermaphroditum]|uniref:DDE_3 domain-containing protein n=1 Tax=Steinernema hermaphroditum TaxID=289476 RepID=A0AA39IGZ7_9BILA|nr:hypothetical protein QR680_007891 [Steinernema hermaphroditum]